MRDFAVFVKIVDGALLILNANTDNALLCTHSLMVCYKVTRHLAQYFLLKEVHGNNLPYLNYRIIQFPNHTSIDQTLHIMKMTDSYFKQVKHIKRKRSDTPFRTNKLIETEIANAQPYTLEEETALKEQFGDYSSNFGSNMHISTCFQLDIECTMH